MVKRLTMLISNTFPYGKYAILECTSYIEEALQKWNELGILVEDAVHPYNYKSGMRAKAINRDTFESDINQLCHIINS